MTAAWQAALAGGVLIGLSASLLLWLNGRVAGVSGVLNGVLFPRRGDLAWRWAFLAGLAAAAAAYQWLLGDAGTLRADFPPAGLVAAGLLVGFGTRMANGCTSGHGVCGLARFSLRSAVAVAVFMLTAMATTFVLRHVWGWP